MRYGKIITSMMENLIILKRDKSRAGSCLSQLCCRVDTEIELQLNIFIRPMMMGKDVQMLNKIKDFCFRNDERIVFRMYFYIYIQMMQ